MNHIVNKMSSNSAYVINAKIFNNSMLMYKRNDENVKLVRCPIPFTNGHLNLRPWNCVEKIAGKWEIGCGRRGKCCYLRQHLLMLRLIFQIVPKLSPHKVLFESRHRMTYLCCSGISHVRNSSFAMPYTRKTWAKIQAAHDETSYHLNLSISDQAYCVLIPLLIFDWLFPFIHRRYRLPIWATPPEDD